MRRVSQTHLKKPVNFLLLLVSLVLLQWLHQEQYLVLSGQAEVAEQVEQDNFSGLPRYELTATFPGKVSSAENRINHSRGHNFYERDENDERRKQQQTFEALSAYTFIYAKYFAVNSHISTKRQSCFSHIIMENRQLRL